MFVYHLFVDDDFCPVIIGGIEQDVFEQSGQDGVQPARSYVFHVVVHLRRNGCDTSYRAVREFDADVFRSKERCVLLQERIPRLGENPVEIFFSPGFATRPG